MRILSAALVFALPALSHGNKPHDHPTTTPPTTPEAKTEHKIDEHPSPHGGQVVVLDATDHLHVEVVFHDGGLRVWLYDQDMKPIAMPDAGKATVVVGKDVQKIEFAKVEKLDDKADPHLAAALPLAKDAKVAVVLQLAVGGKPRTARIERVTTTTPAPTSSAHPH